MTVALLLVAGAAPLSAESAAAAALRARVTLDVIKKYCPLIVFHSQERFFPESIETFTKGAINTKRPPPNRTRIPTPSSPGT